LSDIVLKDKNGKKNTYSGIDVINIADTKGIYNRYVAEPQGEIQITSNGTFDVKNIATAKVNVAGGGETIDLTEIDTLIGEGV
jgi:hypothetical protein